LSESEGTSLAKMDAGSAAVEAVVESGKALRQVNTGFSTAVAVQKPRELKKVMEACILEAGIAGDDFYYAWTIKNKDGSSKLVEGPGIGMAQAAARNWGNCALLMDVREESDAYFFTPTFVDLETGFNLQRVYRQAKKKDIGSKYDKDRAEDIVFQIGQSKATRNVATNALPNYLFTKMMEAAKQNLTEKIKRMGIGPAREKLVEWFKTRGIEIDRLEARLGKKAAVWNEEDLVLLHGAMNSILKNQELPDELFPPTKPEGGTNFGLNPELLQQIANLCADLGVSQANMAMNLGAMKGDVAKAEAYRNELLDKAAEREKKGEGQPKEGQEDGLFEK
jgi:hypothetical protein